MSAPMMTAMFDEQEYRALAAAIAAMVTGWFTDDDELARKTLGEARDEIEALGNERYNALMNRLAAAAGAAFPDMEFDRLLSTPPRPRIDR